MPNYQNGKIYAIRSPQTEMIYIGSTTQSLSQRIRDHRKPSSKPCSSRDIIKFNDNYIELIELFSCLSKEELHAREGYHIRLNRSICVNKIIAGRSKKEYHEYYKNTKGYSDSRIKYSNYLNEKMNNDEEYRNERKLKLKESNVKYINNPINREKKIS